MSEQPAQPVHVQLDSASWRDDALAQAFFAALAAVLSVEPPATLPPPRRRHASRREDYGHAPAWERCTWRHDDLVVTVKLTPRASSVGVHGSDGRWEARWRRGSLELTGRSSLDARTASGDAVLELAGLDDAQRAVCACAFRRALGSGEHADG